MTIIHRKLRGVWCKVMSPISEMKKNDHFRQEWSIFRTESTGRQNSTRKRRCFTVYLLDQTRKLEFSQFAVTTVAFGKLSSTCGRTSRCKASSCLSTCPWLDQFMRCSTSCFNVPGFWSSYQMTNEDLCLKSPS